MSEHGISAPASGGRASYIDWAKALGLIGVLCAHLELPRGVLAPFEVPIFFLASGMLFRDRGESFGTAVRRCAKKLLVPFWVGMFVYTAMDTARAMIIGFGGADVAVLGLINALYGTPCVPDVGFLREFAEGAATWHVQSAPYVAIILPMNCPLWFLPAMFSASVIFDALMRHRRRLPDAAWIALLLAAAGAEHAVGSFPLPYCLSRGALGAACMLAGLKIKESGIITEAAPRRRAAAALAAAAVVCAALHLGTFNTLWIRHIYGPYGAVSMVLAYAMGVAGSFLALLFCRALEQHRVEPICSALSAISRSSMTVYMWHMMIYNISYALYVALTGAELVPDGYMMNLFTSGHVPFRVITLAAALVILTKAGSLHRDKALRRAV